MNEELWNEISSYYDIDKDFPRELIMHSNIYLKRLFFVSKGIKKVLGLESKCI